MFGLIAKVLAAIYNVVPNYGLAIMILTLVIMIVLTPLTLKGTRSMLAMQQLQPEIKKLQAKHKDDRQKLNEEMMAFYRENKINPMSGCLPLLLQMPVFFVLYRVLYGLTSRAPLGNDMGHLTGLVLGGNPSATFPNFGTFAPKYLDHSSTMYQALSKTSQMKSFGIDLSESALKALSGGFVRVLPFLVLVILVTATSYIQQRQVTARTNQKDQNPQQQMLMKIMPLFFAFISLTLPGGVVVYFLVSNVYRVAQQAFITRTMYGTGAGALIPATARVADDGVPDDAAPKKGFLASLGFDRESLPEVGGSRKEANGRSGRQGGSTKVAARSGGAKKAGPSAKGSGRSSGGSKSSGGKSSGGKSSGGKSRSGPTGKDKSSSSGPSEGGSTGDGPRAARPSRSPGAAGSTAAKKAKAPARSSPPPPVNRSRNKKKRK